MSNLEHLEMEKLLTIVFNDAINKSLLKCEKEGNTSKPWKDFSIEHLEKRLEEEYKEYLESKNPDELIDVMNLACFCYIARTGLEIT